MSRDLTTDDLKAIHALTELTAALMTYELAIGDGNSGTLLKRISIANLSKLLMPYNGASNDLQLGIHDVYAANIKSLIARVDTILAAQEANKDAELIASRGTFVTLPARLDFTDEEFATLNDLVTVVGSILKSIKDNAESATFTPVGSVVSTTVKEAIAEVSGYVDLLNNALGSVDGIATLDAGGKVPSAQLPSFVDDVLEFGTLALFPVVGEAGKIYIATETGITYRWSGTVYAEISASLALGETSATAYRGDRGKLAYDGVNTLKSTVDVVGSVLKAIKDTAQKGDFTPTVPSGIAAVTLEDALIEVGTDVEALKVDVPLKAPIDSPTFTGTVGGITKTMVGLGSVNNTADTAKPVSTPQQTALNLKLDKSVITASTLAPSGGVDGDIWFVYA